MSKGKIEKKMILIMLVTMLLLTSIFMPSGVSEAEKIDIKIKPITVFHVPHNLLVPKIVNYMKDSGWPQIFDNGVEDSASAIAIDSQGNIIVTGYSGYISNFLSEEIDFLTVKYDSEGNELWNVTFDSGSYDFAWDVTVDASDDIILFGFNWTSYGDLENLRLYLRVVKYNKEGIEQWNLTFHNAINNYPGGITVDSQDNIIINGGYGYLDALEFNCWTLKMDNNGIILWNQTFTDDLLSIGTDVTVDSNDDIIVGGMSASFFGQGYCIIKYDTHGNKISVHRYGGRQPNAIALDNDENIILTGQSYSSVSESGTWYTIKCDKQGNLLWIREFDSGYNNAADDVSTDPQGNIVTVGGSDFFGDSNYEQCAIIYDKDGNEICMKRPGITGFINGVAIDSEDRILVTGSIQQQSNWDFYTNRYVDITPPSVQLLKPEENYLYIFNTQLFPLSKNTIILGKITVIIDADNPSDVMKVEFYVNNVLKETITEPDYQWTWSGGKLFGKSILKVMAYDETGNIAKYEFNVWKLF